MNAFLPADILFPQVEDISKWAVIACDQFTSDPSYWRRVRDFVGEAPSTLHMILPEAELGAPGEPEKIEKIEKHVIEFEIPELEKQAKEATKIKEAQENFLKCVLGDELWDAIWGNN